MMHRTLMITCLLWGWVSLACSQSLIRKPNEAREDFIARTLPKNGTKVGKSYEFNDSGSTLLVYFEIRNLKPLPRKPDPVQPWAGVPTYTLFHLLIAEDNVHFSHYVLDTIDQNSGCCPCHFPATVDSLLIPNSTELEEVVVLVTRPVRYDCGSVTSYWAYPYENFLTRIRAGEFSFSPEIKVAWSPEAAQNEKAILRAVERRKNDRK